jgi:hypothetical protein
MVVTERQGPGPAFALAAVLPEGRTIAPPPT